MSIRYKGYEVRNEVAVKECGGCILDSVRLVPRDCRVGPLQIVESFMKQKSGRDKLRVKKSKEQMSTDLKKFLSVLEEYGEEMDSKIGTRFEWTFDLTRVEDGQIVDLLEEERRAIVEGCCVISSRHRSELAVRAGATFLVEALGRGPEDDLPLREDRPSLAYRALMEAILKSVVLAPNYEIRHFRRLIDCTFIELASMRFGIPNFSLMPRPSMVDPVSKTVGVPSAAFSDGEKDLRQLIGFIKASCEVTATTLLWGLFIIQSQSDDLVTCCKVIKVIDMAVNYSWYKGKGLLLEGSGIFKEGPFECRARTNAPRYKPTSHCHNQATAKLSAIPATHSITIGEYIGHRFGKRWPVSGPSVSASYLAFQFLLQQIGIHRKEEALLALRDAFLAGDIIELVPPMTSEQQLAKVGEGQGSNAWLISGNGPIQPIDIVAAPPVVLGVGLGEKSPYVRNWNASEALRSFKKPSTRAPARPSRYDWAILLDAMRRYPSTHAGGRISWKALLEDPNNGLVRQWNRGGNLQHFVRRGLKSCCALLREWNSERIGVNIARAERDLDTEVFLATKREFILGRQHPNLDNSDWVRLRLNDDMIARDALDNGIELQTLQEFTDNGVYQQLLNDDAAGIMMDDPNPLNDIVSARGIGFDVTRVESRSTGAVGLTEEQFDAAIMIIDSIQGHSEDWALFSPSIISSWLDRALQVNARGMEAVNILSDSVHASQLGDVDSILDLNIPLFIPVQVYHRWCLFCVYGIGNITDRRRIQTCKVLAFAPTRLDVLRDNLQWIATRFILHLCIAAHRDIDGDRIEFSWPGTLMPPEDGGKDQFWILSVFQGLVYSIEDTIRIFEQFALERDGDLGNVGGLEGVEAWVNSQFALRNPVDQEMDRDAPGEANGEYEEPEEDDELG